MRKQLLKLSSFSLILIGGLFILSCKQENENTIKNTLVADAGSDIIEKIETEIPLDGSESKDTQNKDFSYQWQIIQKPTNASAGIEDDEDAEATFIGNLAGEYLIKLTIYNDNFQNSDTLKVTLVENSLVANAGENLSVKVETEIQLDGSASEDLEGNEFSIEWTVESAPELSTVIFTNEDGLTPIFEADVAGEYQIKLTLSNEFYESSDIVTVTVTPAEETIIIDESINVERTLTNIFTDDRPDYIITRDISVNAALILEPGTIVQMNNGTTLSIETNGSIVAIGEEANPIIFKGATEGAGKWRSLKIYSNNNENRLEYVIIEGAGSGASLDGISAGLSLIGAKVSIVNTVFKNTTGYGLYVREGAELITFANNDFNNNSQTGIRIDAQNVRKLDKETIFSASNGRSGIEVYAPNIDEIGEPHTWTAPNDGSVYLITSGLSVDAGWILEAGVKLQMANDNHISINSNAYIQAKGTQAAPVQFTNRPNGGHWRGMTIYSNSVTNKFEYVTFSNAANSPILSGIKAAVAMWGTASANFQSTEFLNNSGYGLYVSDGTEISAFSGNRFSNNTLAGILINPDNVKQLDAQSIFSDNNGVNAVEVTGGSIDSGIEATWTGFNDGTPYRIKGDISVNIPWYIMSGSNFELGTDVHIAINSGEGAITAVGTEDKKITFTGITEQPGAWQGIIIYSNNVLNALRHVDIKNGGSSNLLSGIKSNMALFSSSKVSIENCSFENSAGYGLHVSSGAEINANYTTINLFSNNTQGEVYEN